MTINLSGLNILLTGASRGIGEAIARQLIASGASVTLHYSKNRDRAGALAQELGPRAHPLQADLADAAQCARLFDEAVKALGHVDVLINNAGVALNAPVDGSDDEWLNAWERTMAVNLRAVGVLCRKAVSHFAQRKSGRIINMASRASFRGDTPEYLAYAASKGGVVPLTRSIARGYGKQGIKAFVVAPGFVRTDMAQDFMDEYGEEFALNDIALSTLTEPKDVAPIVAFLASGLADHATGCTIDVNAGSYVR